MMAAEPGDVRRVIEDKHDAFVRAFNARAFDRMVASHYATDAYVMPSNRPPAQGHAQIVGFYRDLFESTQAKLAPFEIRLVETSGDLAYLVGSYHLTFHPASGPLVEDSGKFVEVWRRQADGSWQSVLDMFSSNQAAG